MNVTLDMDELDVTSAESKATYEEIKEYVLKKHSLQVTNLYIAQVKRRCGIIERENYNKSQKEDAKQPQCPEDKEKAIMDALNILAGELVVIRQGQVVRKLYDYYDVPELNVNEGRLEDEDVFKLDGWVSIASYSDYLFENL